MRLINLSIAPTNVSPGDMIVVACEGRYNESPYGFVATVDHIEFDTDIYVIEYSYLNNGERSTGYKVYQPYEIVDTVVIDGS